MLLEIHVNDTTKTVGIWLTHAEQADMKLKERLKPLYAKYSASKYLVAVYASGDKDLYGSTLDLLAYNKKRIAELELQHEKAAAPEERPPVQTRLHAMRPAAKPAPQKAKQPEYSR